MSDELSRRRRGSAPGQPSDATGDSSGWTHHTDGAPLDMTAVRADDEFLEALARDMPVATDGDAEYQLAALLAGWRHDTLSAPVPEFPSVDDVEHAMIASAPRRPARKAIRHLRLASGAAAVVVVAAAGLTVMSQGASPGDPLWDVKKVVFSEQASQTQAATDAQQNLERAEQAMAQGDVSQAKALVDKASDNLKPVRDEKTRKQMDDWIGRLRASVESSTTPTPGAPTTTGENGRQNRATTTDEHSSSSAPTSVPPDVRNQMRNRLRTATVSPTEPTTQPTTITQAPPATTTTVVPTPTTKVPTPKPRPTTQPGVPPLPPLSIRPH